MTFYVKIPIFIKTQGFLKPFQGEHFQDGSARTLGEGK